MNEPTEEQIKELWEKLGLNLEHEWQDEIHGYEISGYVCERCGAVEEYTPDTACYPKIDLTNLFKWATTRAVAKLIWTGIGTRASWEKLFAMWLDFYLEGMELEDALFWAIYKVIKD